MFDSGPDAEKTRIEWELDNRLAPEDDPEKPPRNPRKDAWIRYGLLTGVVVGGFAGVIVGHRYRYISDAIVEITGAVVGVVAGGVLGTIVGAFASWMKSALGGKRSSQSR